MAGMLELSDRGFKTTVINTLRALMGKADSMQEQMGNISREMEIIRKKGKEMLEIKSTATETKNALHRLVSKLDTGEERL